VTTRRGTKPWPPEDRDEIPWPPPKLPGPAPKAAFYLPDRLWRLHWEEDPNSPPRYPSGRWRFDAPDGAYPVTYANISEHHVFVEVYGDVDEFQIIEEQAERKLSYAESSRPLALVDLGDAEVLRALRIDLRICTTVDYERTMAWSKQLREWLPDADGIRYLGRKGGREDNVCLFLDRCAADILWTPCGTLAENEKLVLEASDMFDLAFDFTVPGHWPEGAGW
jgi:hypothetical protein